jgi:hypothetical protein
MSAIDPSKLKWRKAQGSVNNGACVEVAHADDMVAVRDSKNPAGHVLTYTRHEWIAFLDGAKRGDFNAPR